MIKTPCVLFAARASLQFLAAKDDLVLFWATKVPVRFLALREAAQKFLVFFGSTWSRESGFSAMNHIKILTATSTRVG